MSSMLPPRLILPHLAAALAVGVASPAVASECLTRPAGQVTEVPDGTYSRDLELEAPALNHTFDLRGAAWQVRPPSEPISPVEVETRDGTCVVGLRVEGLQRRDLPWDDVKNSDGLQMRTAGSGIVGRSTIEGLHVRNLGDGLDTRINDRGHHFTARHIYMENIRDDAFENDTCQPIVIEDVLVDGTFVFLASRPGSGNYFKNPSTPVYQISDTLVHVRADLVGDEGGNGKFWKWPGSSSDCTPRPVLDMRNVVLRIDAVPASDDGLVFPPGGSYSNVTLVWAGPGSYPEDVPGGVTVTTDISVWDDARAAWLDAHGCDANGDSCTNLIEPAEGGAPTEPSDPDEGGEVPPPDDGGEPSDPDDGSEAPSLPGEEVTVELTPDRDTSLLDDEEDTPQGAESRLEVDTGAQALIRFDLSGVPAGSEVISAVLTLETTNPGQGAAIHLMIAPWDEGSTWDSMRGGLDASEYGGVAVRTGSVERGTRDFDLTSVVQDWVDGVQNHGIGFITLGKNGWDFRSREGGISPKLTVTYAVGSAS